MVCPMTPQLNRKTTLFRAKRWNKWLENSFLNYSNFFFTNISDFEQEICGLQHEADQNLCPKVRTNN